MRYFLLTSILCVYTGFLFSQENSINDSINNNKTHVIKDSRIDKLNDTYKSSYHLMGYRIQIYSGSKRQPANQARSIFSRLQKNEKAYLSYEQPSYKVRVGDFKTKLEALKFKNELIKNFPNCFIIKDEIEFMEPD